MKQLAPFSTLEQEARKMIASAESIALLPPTPANAKVARTMRLEIRPLRTAVEKRYAELKRPIIDAGNALTEGRDTLLDLLKPMEAKLLAIEQHAEREALRIEDEKRAARVAEITPFLDGPIFLDLGKMPDEEYLKVLANAKDLAQFRVERARKEAEAAAAQVKAEAEERERVAAENARLKKEAEEREAQARKEREAAQAREMALQEIQGIQQQTIIAVMGRAGVRNGGTIECLEETLEETKRWLIDDHFGVLMPAAQKAKEVAIAEIETTLDHKRADVTREKAAAQKARQELESANQKAAEDARIAEEKAQKERLKAAQEKAAAEKKAKAEMEAAKEEARRQQAEADAILEKERKEQARLAGIAEAERQKAATAARKEREAREKLEAEIAEKKAAEEKAKAEKEEAERKASLAPAKEKLIVFAHEVRLLALKTFAIQSIDTVKEVADKTEAFAKWIEKRAGEL